MAHYAHIPLPYQLALEWLDGAGVDRTETRLRNICEHMRETNGYPAGVSHEAWVHDCIEIAGKRFWNFQPGV